MLTFKQISFVAIASALAATVFVADADARRGGGGGGGMRASAGRGGFGGNRAHVSHPIARPGLGNGIGNRPPEWANRPGYRPGYGWGAAAVVGAAAYSGYDNGYAYYGETTDAEAVAYCAQRFRSYDVASRTYLAKNGQRVSCP